MDTKKFGFLILGISIVGSALMFSYMNKLNTQGEQLHCNPTQECQQITSMVGLSHITVGFLAFIFALGFYILFFNKNEQEILEKHGISSQSNDKFSMLLRPLDESERKVLLAIREQEGITQSTLRYRADLSKAKISQILTDFEKKNLVIRKAKGKTYSVFLAEGFS